MKSKRTMPPNTQITDVTQFFAAITEEYEYFERNVLQVTNNIPTCSPEEIQAQCSKISEQKDKLAIMDALFRQHQSRQTIILCNH